MFMCVRVRVFVLRVIGTFAVCCFQASGDWFSEQVSSRRFLACCDQPSNRGVKWLNFFIYTGVVCDALGQTVYRTAIVSDLAQSVAIGICTVEDLGFEPACQLLACYFHHCHLLNNLINFCGCNLDITQLLFFRLFYFVFILLLIEFCLVCMPKKCQCNIILLLQFSIKVYESCRQLKSVSQADLESKGFAQIKYILVYFKVY